MRRSLQSAMRPVWAWKVGYRGRPHTLGNLREVLAPRSGLEDFSGWIAGNFDPSVTWSDLAWVRERWQGPFIVKGVLDPADAGAAVKIGADGIVVSNHGGRQLDGVDATIDALPAIADLARGTTTILVDGGVRSGLDVLKMLGSGAHGVLLGRAWAFALAAGGESAVTCLLENLRSELHAAMALTGTASLAQATTAIAR
jgi:L-lactate dehydrogenase (cytochrome)